jgi:hypothetical protein
LNCLSALGRKLDSIISYKSQMLDNRLEMNKIQIVNRRNLVFEIYPKMVVDSKVFKIIEK